MVIIDGFKLVPEISTRKKRVTAAAAKTKMMENNGRIEILIILVKDEFKNRLRLGRRCYSL